MEEEWQHLNESKRVNSLDASIPDSASDLDLKAVDEQETEGEEGENENVKKDAW